MKQKIGCSRSGKLPPDEKDLCQNCLLKFEEDKCKENVRRNNWFIIYMEV
jgi:hypothetical protein